MKQLEHFLDYLEILMIVVYNKEKKLFFHSKDGLIQTVSTIEMDNGDLICFSTLLGTFQYFDAPGNLVKLKHFNENIWKLVRRNNANSELST